MTVSQRTYRRRAPIRILVISNFYPPNHIGGYELGCHDVVEDLKSRGHSVTVLTSNYGRPSNTEDPQILRRLTSSLGWRKVRPAIFVWKIIRKEISNRRALLQVCNNLRPNVVYIWNAAHISLSLAFTAQERGHPVCYYISDHWLSNWKDDLWYSFWQRVPTSSISRAAKNACRRVFTFVGLLNLTSRLDLNHSQYTSQYIKTLTAQSGLGVSRAPVIHWGVKTEEYKYRTAGPKRCRLLFVGQLVKHKGPDTAIEALGLIKEQFGQSDLTLTIAGGGLEPEYEQYLRALTVFHKLETEVVFTGQLARADVMKLYGEHDILLFPSLWNEPFSIALLEAMSSGLAVVATDTGGSSEILEHEKNALTFNAGDARRCASQIRRLITDADLFETIRKNARLTVEARFTFNGMVDEIEKSLTAAVAGDAFVANVPGELTELTYEG